MNAKEYDKKSASHQHKNTLLELFDFGATVEEVLLFLEENNFIGISYESLKSC